MVRATGKGLGLVMAKERDPATDLGWVRDPGLERVKDSATDLGSVKVMAKDWVTDLAMGWDYNYYPRCATICGRARKPVHPPQFLRLASWILG